MHLMISGQTRKGKSTTVLEYLMRSNDVKVLLAKEAKATSRDFVKWCVETSAKVIYDDADDELVFPLSVLDRQGRRELCIEGMLESLMRRRGAKNADENPLIETVTEHWANLVYELDLEIDEAMKLFRQGRIRDVSPSSDFWNEVPGGSARERILGATERLVSIFNKGCLRNRITRNGNRFLDMIDEGYSYALEGGHNITQAEMRFLIGSRINEVIRYKRSGGSQPITIVIEESEALGLTMQEAVAIQTLGKTGLKWVIVCQEANWG